MSFKRLNTLGQLLGCYLHQDWLDEFHDADAALQAIQTSVPKAQIEAAVEEIDALLAVELHDNDLRKIIVDQLGCYFDPSSEGLTCEQWLGRVRNAFSGR